MTRRPRSWRSATDAYLAGLARARRGRVATLGRRFAAAASDVAELVDAG